jgi:hypothetical protein
MKQLILATRFVTQNYRGLEHETPPHVEHALDVAYILNTFGYVDNEEIIVAAVLHDILSQKNISIQEVKQAFGPQVADIVQSCDQYNKLGLKADAQAQLDYLTRLPNATKIILLANVCAEVTGLMLQGLLFYDETSLFLLQRLNTMIQSLCGMYQPLTTYAARLLNESTAYLESKKLPVVDQVASH